MGIARWEPQLPCLIYRIFFFGLFTLFQKAHLFISPALMGVCLNTIPLFHKPHLCLRARG